MASTIDQHSKENSKPTTSPPKSSSGAISRTNIQKKIASATDAGKTLQFDLKPFSNIQKKIASPMLL